jgi:hypothetical protein
MQATGVGLTGCLLLFRLVTETQLDEFHTECGRESKHTGDAVRRVDIAGPCHAVIELGKQTELDARRGQSAGKSVRPPATQDVPCSDSDPAGELRGRIGGSQRDLAETRQLGQQAPMRLVAPQLT